METQPDVRSCDEKILWSGRLDASAIEPPHQCDQIGWFSEFRGNIFYYKSSQNVWDFLGSCEKHCFLSQAD